MPPSDRRRTDPAVHAYTVPVVREVPIGHGSGQASSEPHAGAASRLRRRLARLVTVMRTPIAPADRPWHRVVPVERRTSQRELVAWSLLRCPDDRPFRDRP